jgi:hypothetical protein
MPSEATSLDIDWQWLQKNGVTILGCQKTVDSNRLIAS